MHKKGRFYIFTALIIKYHHIMKTKFLHLLLVAMGFLLASCSESSTDSNEPPTPPAPEKASISLILGEVTGTTAVLDYTTTNASEAAALCLPASQTEPEIVHIMEMGQALKISEEQESLLFEGLKGNTEYKIYAVAKNSDGEFCSVKSLEFTTLVDRPDMPDATHISLVETSKTSFTYAIEVEDGSPYYLHTYLEGWLFEYLLMQNYMTNGEEFEMDVFLKQCLADYGLFTMGSSEHNWSAGDPNETRNPFFAAIVGGKEYYALYAPINAEANVFLGDAEVISFSTEPTGESTSKILLTTESLSAQGVSIRMEMTRGVRFFFYDLYPTEQVETRKAEQGIEGMKDYLYEYGWAVANTYTDGWTINPATSYTLCVMGVDNDGDTFYQELVVESPELIPSVSVTLRPYERELQGFHAYDTFELTVYPWNFYDEMIDPSKVRHLFARQSEVEAALGSLTLAELAENPTEENIALLNPLLENLSAEIEAMFNEYGYISSLLTELEADTEYCYLTIVPWRDTYRVGYTVQATEPLYGGDTPTDAYKAYLGEWVITGQSSEDYFTRETLTIRFEELVSNRNYKVYGWSNSVLGEEFPFEARFHPETGKISIESIQQLGRMIVGEYEYVVVFTGMTTAGGELTPHGGYSGVVYEGRCDGTHLSMFPSMFQYNGYDYSFMSMAYSLYYGGYFFAMDGDEFPLVNFTIDRPTQTTAHAAAKEAGKIAKTHKTLSAPTALHAQRK